MHECDVYLISPALLWQNYTSVCWTCRRLSDSLHLRLCSRFPPLITRCPETPQSRLVYSAQSSLEGRMGTSAGCPAVVHSFLHLSPSHFFSLLFTFIWFCFLFHFHQPFVSSCLFHFKSCFSCSLFLFSLFSPFFPFLDFVYSFLSLLSSLSVLVLHFSSFFSSCCSTVSSLSLPNSLFFPF